MNLKKIVTTAAMLSALTLSANTASAEPQALNAFNAYYQTAVTNCLLCHTTSTAAGGVLNSFGLNFKTAGGTKPAYAPNLGALDVMDADGDGTDNKTQIVAGNAPAGNGTLTAFTVPAAAPAPAAPAAPGGGGGGCVTSSVTTPLMMVLAMLSLGFFVRRKKD